MYVHLSKPEKRKLGKKLLLPQEKMERWQQKRQQDYEEIQKLNNQITKLRDEGNDAETDKVNEIKVKLQRRHASQRFREKEQIKQLTEIQILVKEVMSLKRKNKELTEAISTQRCLKCFKCEQDYLQSSAYPNGEEETSKHYQENEMQQQEHSDEEMEDQ